MENETLNGAVSTPSQPASEPSTQTPSAIDYQKLAEALQPVIAGEVTRNFQSGKDKRIAKLTGQVDEFAKRLERYFEYSGGGKVDPKALREMQIDELLGEQPAPQNASAVTAGPKADGTANQPGTMDVETLQALDLDPNSPEVTELLRRDAPMGDYISLLKRRKAKPAPTAAQVLSQPAGTVVTGETVDTLVEELNRLMPNPGKNMARIKEINAKLSSLR